MGLAWGKDCHRHAHDNQHPSGSIREGPNIRGESPNTGAFGYGQDFYAREFWRFVLVQQYVAKLAKTAIDYPPMQTPASFNLDEVKKKVEATMKQHEGQ